MKITLPGDVLEDIESELWYLVYRYRRDGRRDEAEKAERLQALLIEAVDDGDIVK
ncbi:MAG: hypothetical protein LUG98_13105 [Tannerellaceae bacterium]|nr:hypothetical protein [Tannerellaceae bacterium]